MAYGCNFDNQYDAIASMKGTSMLAKTLSRTLAAEIAERTLRVVNPTNRPLALNEALRRHGFATTNAKPDELPRERAALVAWLLERYRT